MMIFRTAVAIFFAAFTLFGQMFPLPSPIAPRAPFSMVWISDQHPTGGSSDLLWDTNSAYVLAKIIPWNVKAILSTGDEPAYGETLPNFASHGWDALIATGLPVIGAPGNHDYNSENVTTRDANNASSTFDTYIGYSKLSGKSYGPILAFSGTGNDVGVYTDAQGGKANYAIRFAVNGHKFLVIALEFFPRTAVLTWAANLGAVYPDHKIIWVTHAYIAQRAIPCTAVDTYCADPQSGGTGYQHPTLENDGQHMYDALFKGSANGFLTISGHFPDPSGGQYWQKYESTGTNGNHLIGVYADYQNFHTTNQNDLILRLSFHEATATFDIIGMHALDDTVLFQYLALAWPQ